MGYYINPPDMSKEQFLQMHGVPIPASQAKESITPKTLPVCLVDNGEFTAAGIGFDLQEVDNFLRPDNRPKRWYSLTREDLAPYYNEP